MRPSVHILLTLAASLPFVGCARPAASPDPAERPAASVRSGARDGAREGHIDAGDGVALFYRTVGRGADTVVVLHGGPGFPSGYLAPDLEPLADDRVLLFYDQRGTGRSTVVADSAALVAERYADDLEAVRRHFGLRRLTLLGHSWGAGVAALHAARYPGRIGRLLVVGPIPATRGYFTQAFADLEARRDTATRRRIGELRATRLADPGDPARCRAYYAAWFAHYFADTAALRRTRGDFCAGSREALANKVHGVDRATMPSLGDWDWRPALRTIDAPALVIHGTEEFIPVPGAREWAAALPNGRLLLLEGSGHFPYLEVPGPFFAAADAFLRGGWPAGARRVESGDR